MRRRLFKATIVDPPWPENGGGGRGAQNHYPVLKVRDIPGVILGADNWNPAADSHLYLWATNTFLPSAIAMLPELGFAYKTMVTWTKPHISIGQYFRGRTEHMLFATRGKGYAARTDDRSLTTHITGCSGRVHSRKPDEAYALVEARSHGPYAELFARTPRPGWVGWGNEYCPPVK